MSCLFFFFFFHKCHVFFSSFFHCYSFQHSTFWRHLQFRLYGAARLLGIPEDCHEWKKQLRKSFLLLSADRCFAGFYSCHQYKHCDPRPRPWYSCLFTSTIHPDASWGKKKKMIQVFFILPAVKDLILVPEFSVCQK